MSKKQITITIDAEVADWLIEEVASHFFWGAYELQDYAHIAPTLEIYRALVEAGVPQPERESESQRRAMENYANAEGDKAVSE